MILLYVEWLSQLVSHRDYDNFFVILGFVHDPQRKRPAERCSE